MEHHKLPQGKPHLLATSIRLQHLAKSSTFQMTSVPIVIETSMTDVAGSH